MHRNSLFSILFFFYFVSCAPNPFDKTLIMSFDHIVVNRFTCTIVVTVTIRTHSLWNFCNALQFSLSDNNMQIEAYAIFTSAHGIYADITK